MSLRAVIFDFDNTLCIHPMNRVYSSEWDTDFIEDTFKMEWEKVYRDCTAPEAMKRLIARVQAETEADVMMLTQVSFSHYVTAKEAWLERDYGDTFTGKCYGCGKRESKLHFLQMLCSYYGCSPAEIVLVDDNEETVQECRKAGFIVLDTINVLMQGGNISLGGSRDAGRMQGGNTSFGCGRDTHRIHSAESGISTFQAVVEALIPVNSVQEADCVVSRFVQDNSLKGKITFLQRLFNCWIDASQLGEAEAYRLLLLHAMRECDKY